MKFRKKNNLFGQSSGRHARWLVLASGLFFFVYLYLYFGVPGGVAGRGQNQPQHLIFNQPDESVNYFFIRRFALEGEFGYPEPLAQVSRSQVHPRSTTVVDGRVVPIGFPGMILLFGLAARAAVALFGPAAFNLAVVSLTPLAAVIMPWFLFGALRRIFNDRLAFISALLAYILPPWWYYASRPLQHNTLFVTCVVAFIYLLTRLWDKRQEERQWPVAALAGLAYGLCVYVRPAEAVWLTVGALVATVLSRKFLKPGNIAAAALALCFLGAVFFMTQTAYYGHPFGTGYARPAASGAAGLVFSGPQGLSFAQAIFLPFGWHPAAMLKTAYQYVFRLFPAWFMVALVGLMLSPLGVMAKLPLSGSRQDFSALICRDVRQLRVRFYTLGFALLGVYLLAFYGSCYFLPLYVLALPFGALVIDGLRRLATVGKLAAALIAAALLLTSAKSVFVSFEGLIMVRGNVETYYDWRGRIIESTEPDAVLVTHYADKYLFPVRKVIPDWKTDEELGALQALVLSGEPLYWYDLAVTAEAETRLRSAFSGYGLRLSAPVAGWDSLELRRIEPEES